VGRTLLSAAFEGFDLRYRTQPTGAPFLARPLREKWDSPSAACVGFSLWVPQVSPVLRDLGETIWKVCSSQTGGWPIRHLVIPTGVEGPAVVPTLTALCSAPDETQGCTPPVCPHTPPKKVVIPSNARNPYPDTNDRGWFDWGRSDLPNSVIPTGTDHRKAMICGVEGPAIGDVTQLRGHRRSSRNRRQENTKERQVESA